MRFFLLLLFTFFGSGARTATADTAPAVLASIKPLQALVAGVMQGMGEPGLIVEGRNSPHGFSLKPSQAAAIEKAGLIFWIGPELETFLAKPVETIGQGAISVELGNAPGLVLLPAREGGAFETHDHVGDDSGHGEGTRNGLHAIDPHLWLDPENAKAMVDVIVASLTDFDPANASSYQANGRTMTEKLTALESEVEEMIAPVRNRNFIVLHDAYQYFERRFEIPASGSITTNPEVPPGAERMRDVREKVRQIGVTCIFSEPQFQAGLVELAGEGSSFRTGILDPLGSDLGSGPQMYFDLIRDIARTMRICLEPV